VSTWAPRGHTPVLRHLLTRDHLSLIGGVTRDGRLVVHQQRPAINSAGATAFLDRLHAAIPGKLRVIWDGASIHRSQVIRQYLADGAARWLRLEALPGYAPELNPAEGVWQSLKQTELPNRSCTSLVDLESQADAALARIGARPALIRAFFRHAGLS